MDKLKYQVIQDEELNILFDSYNFGSDVNENVNKKRRYLVKYLLNKRGKYWVGHTIFRMMVSAGLVNDFMPYNKVTLTLRGILFLQQEVDNNGKFNQWSTIDNPPEPGRLITTWDGTKKIESRYQGGFMNNMITHWIYAIEPPKGDE